MAVELWKVVVVVVMLYGAVLVSECTECPDPCRCFINLDQEQSVTVDCRGQDLESIPSPLPNATSHL